MLYFLELVLRFGTFMDLLIAVFLRANFAYCLLKKGTQALKKVLRQT